MCLCHEGGVSQSAVLVEKHASARDGGWERDPSSSRGIVGIHGALVALQWGTICLVSISGSTTTDRHPSSEWLDGTMEPVQTRVYFSGPTFLVLAEISLDWGVPPS